MLKVQNIRKTYDNGVAALGGVTLTIPVGMYGLLGPNGAGKSSLMRTIATLQTPDSGTVLLDGQDAFMDTLDWRRQLGYLPQDFGVYKSVSARELLKHLAILKGIAGRAAVNEAVDDMLERVNLWSVRDQHVSNYSGGMRQRFGLAQALIASPRLVIVDEPTAGLDPDERNRILDLLTSFSQNAVIILSTHFVQDVKDVCDKMAVMVKGTVMAECTPDEALAVVAGRVWEKAVSPEELSFCEQNLTVLSKRLVRRQQWIRVFAQERPAPGYTTCAPDIEDAYFLELRRGLAAAAQV